MTDAEDETGFKVSLLAVRARIKSGKNVSTSRGEMSGLVVLCQLVTAVLPDLEQISIEIMGNRECTNATVESEDTVLQLFFVNYVSKENGTTEIK